MVSDVDPSRCFVTGMQSPFFGAGFAFTNPMNLKPRKPITYVYIDGFNLYYGCFKRRSRLHWSCYKWLDLEQFCDSLFPKNDVAAIKYYTADVSDRQPDNHQGDRQKAYLTALSRLRRVKIIKGHFLGPKVVRMPECHQDGSFCKMVTVLKTEEKGSDVNLAVDLLFDAAQGNYDCAIVVSNDSDLVGSIKLVRSKYDRPIGLVNPHTRQSVELAQNTDFHVRLTEQVLANCQLPETIQIGSSTISRPAEWR